MTIKIFLLSAVFIFLSVGFKSLSYSQSRSSYNINARAYLDSVKIYYGDTCRIGVSSSLIRGLYKYSSFKPVSAYIKQYENIRKRIISYRNQSLGEI